MHASRLLSPANGALVEVSTPRVDRTAVATSVGGLSVLAVSHFGADLLTGAFSALLPLFQTRFGLSGPDVATLAALLATTSSFGQPVAGRLADRIGARTLAGVGAATTTTALAVALAAPSLWLLAVLTGIGGFGAAAYHPAAAALTRRARPEQAGVAMSIFGAGGALGLAIGPIVGFALVEQFGALAAAILVVPGLLAVVLVRLRVPPDIHAGTCAAPRPRARAVLSDLRPFIVTITLVQLAATAFTTAVPLWLASRGDHHLIGWALGLYAAAAAASGMAAAAAIKYVSARMLATTAILIGLAPLILVTVMTPGTPTWFSAIIAAGALIHAGTPVLMAAGQERLPNSVAAASGALMGLPVGVAGLLYILLATVAAPLGHSMPVVLAAIGLVPAAGAVRIGLRGGQPAPSAVRVATLGCGCNVGRGAIAA